MPELVAADLQTAYERIARRHNSPPEPEWVEFAELLAANYIPPATGRHSVLADKEIIAVLLTQLAKGNYRDTAAHLAGTTWVTVNSLLKRGEDGETPFNAFLWAVKRAENIAEDGAVQQVRSAGSDPRFWAAPMTWLQRKYPEKYDRGREDSAPRLHVSIGVSEQHVQVLQVNVTSVSPTPNTLSPQDSLCITGLTADGSGD